MTMIEWARREVALVCEKEYPYHPWTKDYFFPNYGCYKSALKAYESIVFDGHSGNSFEVTKNILKRLLDKQPLTPITDDDFWKENVLSYKIENGIKSSIQCSRMSGLFRDEHIDGSITYHDINRAYCQNIEFPSDTFTSGLLCKIVDEIDPITMPYNGTIGKWVIYTTTFLCDKRHGDYDHHSIEYVEGPDGKIYDIQRYWRENAEGKMVECSKEEYEYDKKYLRIDHIAHKISELLYSDINCNLHSKGIYLTDKQTNALFEKLEHLCLFFENCNPKYRKWRVIHDIVDGIYECDDEDVKVNMDNLTNFVKEFIKNNIEVNQDLKNEE